MGVEKRDDQDENIHKDQQCKKYIKKHMVNARLCQTISGVFEKINDPVAVTVYGKPQQNRNQYHGYQPFDGDETLYVGTIIYLRLSFFQMVENPDEEK
jgi:hypothetical protein